MPSASAQTIRRFSTLPWLSLERIEPSPPFIIMSSALRVDARSRLTVIGVGAKRGTLAIAAVPVPACAAMPESLRMCHFFKRRLFDLAGVQRARSSASRYGASPKQCQDWVPHRRPLWRQLGTVAAHDATAGRLDSGPPTMEMLCGHGPAEFHRSRRPGGFDRRRASARACGLGRAAAVPTPSLPRARTQELDLIKP